MAEPQHRKIIHIDLDAFFASVEQRDNPSLRGKAIAVGLNQARGVVASASYEARKFGVHSAQPSSLAAKCCPNLIFVPGRMDVYKAVSSEIFKIFSRYTDLVEPVSIDEAFLDVTHNFVDCDLGVEIAKQIKAEIKLETGLVASAGISYNKFLAKIASDWRKPDGLCVIHPSRALAFIDQLPVKAIWGVGPVTANKMKALNIETGRQLREKDVTFLVHHFGRAGYTYYQFSRGIDNRKVTPLHIRKQVGSEVTFEKNISDMIELKSSINTLAIKLSQRLKKSNFLGTSLTLKIRFENFQTITRTLSIPDLISEPAQINHLACGLLSALDLRGKAVRLIGLSIGHRYLEDEQELYLPFKEFGTTP